MIAKMNAYFDKSDYEKGRSLKPDESVNEIINKNDTQAMLEGDVIEQAIKDTLASGKIGSLTVDPNYLDFVALECKYSLNCLKGVDLTFSVQNNR